MNDGETYAQTTCAVGGDLILPETPTRRGYTFKGWTVGYIRLEYIESTGTQWIDTGITGTTTSGLKVYVDVKGTHGNPSNVLISANSGSNAGQWFGHNNEFWTSGTGAVSNVVYNTRIQTTVSFGTEVSFTLNGITYTRTGNIPSGETTKLFSDTKLSSYNAGAQLYSCKIWNNNTLVRNFIPAKRNSDSVIGMYDTVSGQFFTNAGTGTFTAGPIAENQNFNE